MEESKDNTVNSPVKNNGVQVSDKLLQNQHTSNKKFIMFVFALLLVCIFFFLFLKRNSPSEESITLQIPAKNQDALPTTETINQEAAPTIKIDDVLSNESVKPIYSIDISNWRESDELPLGIRFKLPAEWKDFSESSLEDYDEYTIYSHNSKTSEYEGGYNALRVHGQSISNCNAMMCRSYDGVDTGEFCSSLRSAHVLYCQQTGNRIDLLIGGYPKRGGGSNLIPLFYREIILYRPEQKIKYVSIRINYLSNQLASIYDAQFVPIPSKEQYESINKAIVERQLDEASMINLDTIDKIFSSIELY